MFYQYRSLLPTMIGDWRSRFGVGAFPFYIVQLASFTAPVAQPGNNEWAELREAQWITAMHVPHSGIAVTTDIGDAADIHPKDKQDVGRRLARWRRGVFRVVTVIALVQMPAAPDSAPPRD